MVNKNIEESDVDSSDDELLLLHYSEPKKVHNQTRLPRQHQIQQQHDIPEQPQAQSHVVAQSHEVAQQNDTNASDPDFEGGEEREPVRRSKRIKKPAKVFTYDTLGEPSSSTVRNK